MNKLVIKISSVIFIILTFSLVFVTALSGIFSEDKSYSETENRYLASFPEISLNSVSDGSFMSGFESYLSDQFILRDKIVSLKTFISRVLGKTEINDVYIGKNNRLFEVPSAIDDKKLSENIDAINGFSAKCEIDEQYIIIAPNSSYVYKNDLPDYLDCYDQKSEIISIYDKIDGKIIKTDVTDILSENAEKKELYFRTDHHWTQEAAFLAFSEFAKNTDIKVNAEDYEIIEFSNSFSGTLASSSGIYETVDTLKAVMPVNIQGSYYVHNFSTQEKSVSVFDFDKLDTKNQYEVFFGGNFSRIVINTDNLNEKALLIFKDSYANCFIPLLIPHFEKIVIIDPRYFTDDVEDILADNDFTHLLYLYNLNTFLEDTVLKEVIS